MQAFQDIAAKYGINPKDQKAVENFFHKRLPRLSMPEQDRIFRQLKEKTGVVILGHAVQSQPDFFSVSGHTIKTIKPIELEETDSFTVQIQAPKNYWDFMALPSPQIDHGICSVCHQNVMIFRLFQNQPTCYYCYVEGDW